MKPVRISVCMATYNGERFLYRQLESIIQQLTCEDEIVISDDGSDDSTIEIIKKFQSAAAVSIRVFSHSKDVISSRYGKNHIYTTKNFENAISKANGQYIFLADQDDVWLPNKVELFMNLFKKSDAYMIFSNYSVCDENENIVCNSMFSDNPQKWSFLKKNIKPLYWGCCMAFTSSVKNILLPFPKKLYCHDAFIGLALTKYDASRVQFISTPTLLYRRHSMTVSTCASKSKNPLWFKIFWRLSLLFAVYGRYRYIKKHKDLMTNV